MAITRFGISGGVARQTHTPIDVSSAITSVAVVTAQEDLVATVTPAMTSIGVVTLSTTYIAGALDKLLNIVLNKILRPVLRKILK